ncbi:hypothetical protein BDV19DRAFT_385880 [Aspergillus venezuelensis]
MSSTGSKVPATSLTYLTKPPSPAKHNEAKAVDVIVVHGLDGDSRNAYWTADCGTLWPRDLLTKDFPHARVFAFDYDARAVFTGSPKLLSNVANVLLTEFALARRGTPSTRPLVLVGHGFGGFVVEAAIAYDRSHATPFLKFKNCLKNIILLSTPQSDAPESPWSDILVNCAKDSLTGKSPSTAPDVEVLQSVHRMADPIRNTVVLARKRAVRLRVRVLSAYEDVPTPPLQTCSVTEATAEHGTKGETVPKMSGCDYHSIARFSSRDDNNYVSIVAGIKKALKTAPKDTGAGPSKSTAVPQEKQPARVPETKSPQEAPDAAQKPLEKPIKPVYAPEQPRSTASGKILERPVIMQQPAPVKPPSQAPTQHPRSLSIGGAPTSTPPSLTPRLPSNPTVGHKIEGQSGQSVQPPSRKALPASLAIQPPTRHLSLTETVAKDIWGAPRGDPSRMQPPARNMSLDRSSLPPGQRPSSVAGIQAYKPYRPESMPPAPANRDSQPQSPKVPAKPGYLHQLPPTISAPTFKSLGLTGSSDPRRQSGTPLHESLRAGPINRKSLPDQMSAGSAPASGPNATLSMPGFGIQTTTRSAPQPGPASQPTNPTSRAAGAPAGAPPPSARPSNMAGPGQPPISGISRPAPAPSPPTGQPTVGMARGLPAQSGPVPSSAPNTSRQVPPTAAGKYVPASLSVARPGTGPNPGAGPTPGSGAGAAPRQAPASTFLSTRSRPVNANPAPPATRPPTNQQQTTIPPGASPPAAVRPPRTSPPAGNAAARPTPPAPLGGYATRPSTSGPPPPTGTRPSGQPPGPGPANARPPPPAPPRPSSGSAPTAGRPPAPVPILVAGRPSARPTRPSVPGDSPPPLAPSSRPGPQAGQPRPQPPAGGKPQTTAPPGRQSASGAPGPGPGPGPRPGSGPASAPSLPGRPQGPAAPAAPQPSAAGKPPSAPGKPSASAAPAPPPPRPGRPQAASAPGPASPALAPSAGGKPPGVSANRPSGGAAPPLPTSTSAPGRPPAQAGPTPSKPQPLAVAGGKPPHPAPAGRPPVSAPAAAAPAPSAPGKPPAPAPGVKPSPSASGTPAPAPSSAGKPPSASSGGGGGSGAAGGQPLKPTPSSGGGKPGGQSSGGHSGGQGHAPHHESSHPGHGTGPRDGLNLGDRPSFNFGGHEGGHGKHDSHGHGKHHGNDHGHNHGYGHEHGHGHGHGHSPDHSTGHLHGYNPYDHPQHIPENHSYYHPEYETPYYNPAWGLGYPGYYPVPSAFVPGDPAHDPTKPTENQPGDPPAGGEGSGKLNNDPEAKPTTEPFAAPESTTKPIDETKPGPTEAGESTKPTGEAKPSTSGSEDTTKPTDQTKTSADGANESTKSTDDTKPIGSAPEDAHSSSPSWWSRWKGKEAEKPSEGDNAKGKKEEEHDKSDTEGQKESEKQKVEPAGTSRPDSSSQYQYQPYRGNEGSMHQSGPPRGDMDSTVSPATPEGYLPFGASGFPSTSTTVQPYPYLYPGGSLADNQAGQYAPYPGQQTSPPERRYTPCSHPGSDERAHLDGTPNGSQYPTSPQPQHQPSGQPESTDRDLPLDQENQSQIQGPGGHGQYTPYGYTAYSPSLSQTQPGSANTQTTHTYISGQPFSHEQHHVPGQEASHMEDKGKGKEKEKAKDNKSGLKIATGVAAGVVVGGLSTAGIMHALDDDGDSEHGSPLPSALPSHSSAGTDHGSVSWSVPGSEANSPVQTRDLGFDDGVFSPGVEVVEHHHYHFDQSDYGNTDDDDNDDVDSVGWNTDADAEADSDHDSVHGADRGLDSPVDFDDVGDTGSVAIANSGSDNESITDWGDNNSDNDADVQVRWNTDDEHDDLDDHKSEFGADRGPDLDLDGDEDVQYNQALYNDGDDTYPPCGQETEDEIPTPVASDWGSEHEEGDEEHKDIDTDDEKSQQGSDGGFGSDQDDTHYDAGYEYEGGFYGQADPDEDAGNTADLSPYEPQAQYEDNVWGDPGLDVDVQSDDGDAAQSDDNGGWGSDDGERGLNVDDDNDNDNDQIYNNSDNDAGVDYDDESQGLGDADQDEGLAYGDSQDEQSYEYQYDNAGSAAGDDADEYNEHTGYSDQDAGSEDDNQALAYEEDEGDEDNVDGGEWAEGQDEPEEDEPEGDEPEGDEPEGDEPEEEEEDQENYGEYQEYGAEAEYGDYGDYDEQPDYSGGGYEDDGDAYDDGYYY